MNHENGFSTTLTSNQVGGVTTTPIDAIPSVDAPYYLALDATDLNGNYEVITVTSDTATNVNHAATSNAHTIAEEVRMIIPAEEADAIQTGWNPIPGTCTYASATTFTIASIDYTTTFTKGTKIKMTNDGSTKYFYVVSSAFGANTTVTVTGESDIANAAITAACYSYSDCPKGFKRGQDWYRARAYAGSELANVADTAGAINQLNTESFDPNSNFSTVTYKYTAPISGYYQVNVNTSYSAGLTDTAIGYAQIRVNGATQHTTITHSGSETRMSVFTGGLIEVSKGDTIESWYFVDLVGAATADIDDGSTLTFMDIQFIVI